VQGILIWLFWFLLLMLPLFLILLVLIQRGKGGGLAGAFGGMGGQSAFGTKAGDLFTRITIGVAAVWIILCVFSVWYFTYSANVIGNIQTLPSATEEGEDQTGEGPATPGPQSGSSESPQPAAPASPQPPGK
jgi:preprotein translocase subunit SecG